MSDYDQRVFSAKNEITQLICSLVSDDERKHRFAVEMLPGAIDNLNKAWDDLTNCLVRQRIERGDEVLRLLDKLAEAKK